MIMDERFDNRNWNFSGEEINDTMNSWKEISLSPADTYIEWRFEYRCKKLSNGYQIISEWRTDKIQYINISDTTIFDFQHYSRHDKSHSKSILEAIELLLGKKRIDLLSVSDLWLLLEVAYTHDIGMALTYEEILDLWENDEEFYKFINWALYEDFGDVHKAANYYKQMDNLLHNKQKMEGVLQNEEVEFSNSWPVFIQKYSLILVAEYIRGKHAERVQRVNKRKDEKKETIIPSRLYRIAHIASQMHGRNFGDILKFLKYSTKGFGCDILHPQFAAAMLRIGDLLDIDNNRFNAYAIEHFGRLPFVSLLHLKKHESISHISISESEINAEAHVSQYEVGLLANDWFDSINNEIKNLICYWNEIVPEALIGCTLRPSKCQVYMNNKNGSSQPFDTELQKEFTINKRKLMDLLIGKSIYGTEMEFLREYLQNALDASKMQLWIDLQNGKYRGFINPKITDLGRITPLDLSKYVYENYRIKVEMSWNDTQDKIRLKIIDQGIGIEKAYLNNLAEIGAGWKGRTFYQKTLKEILDWLYPTGGFGIGIQSAFMAVDIIEILTKSDLDQKAYKVILNSPEREGSITVEEISDYYIRGTCVSMEIEPEKFPYWAAKLQNYYNDSQGDNNTEKILMFDRDKWDEFDPDAILYYALQVVNQYIKIFIPEPLFPIEVLSPVWSSDIHNNSYISVLDFWQKGSMCITKSIRYEDNEYRCFWVNNDRNIYGIFFAVIWDGENGIVHRIFFKEQENENKCICFKNVLVKDINLRELQLLKSFDFCTDFIGFKAEECLMLDRNRFNEKFSFQKYCIVAFQVLLLFIKNLLNQAESKEKYVSVKKVWGSYLTQLPNTILSPDNVEISDDEDEKEVVHYMFSVNENKQLIIDKTIEMVNQDKLLKNLKTFYQSMYQEKRIKKQVIFLYTENVKGEMKDEEYITYTEGLETKNERIHPNTVIKWLDLNQQQKNNDEFIILKELTKGIGVIKDKLTIEMLIGDKRLEHRKLLIADIAILMLMPKAYGKDKTKKEIYEYFCKQSLSTQKGRKYLEIFDMSDFDNLLVDEIPYITNNVLNGKGYLISPISSVANAKVYSYIYIEKKFSYEIFRELVWGKKGNETPEYHMMIAWVVKHSAVSANITMDDVIHKYEEMLRELYETIFC